MLFDVLNRYQPKEVLINDINKELINTYSQIKNSCDSLISQLSEIQSIYQNHTSGENKDFFYEKRQRYNDLKVSGNDTENLEKAVLFIFLNKTCFNGLYRVNSKGFFNVPFNNAKNPLLGDEAIALGAINAGLSGVYAYPGTPSTEITEYIQNHPLAKERGIHSRWCTNEKTAMEAAL